MTSRIFSKSLSCACLLKCSGLDRSTIQRYADQGTKLGVCLNGAFAIAALVNFNVSSTLTYVSYAALTWLGGRSLSYFCTQSTHDLLYSKSDHQYGLKVSSNVNVIAFCRNPQKIWQPIGLTEADVVITPLKNQVERIEFVASKTLITQFLSCVQACKEEEVSYILSPLYEENQTKNQISSKPKNELVDLKISDFITLVVFAPNKCDAGVELAISLHRREKTRQNSPQTFSEAGVARWESMGVLPFPSNYEACEKEEENKITTEILRSDLLKALRDVANAHTYHEVGYDLYPTYVPYSVHTKNPTQYEVMRKISNYVKFVCSGFENLHISRKLKLTAFAPPDSADRVRKIIGESGGGIIGNYAHCTFSIGEIEEQSKTHRIVRIETVVLKTVFREIAKAFDTQLKGKVTYKLQPIFERIDTKILRQSFFRSIPLNPLASY